MGLSERLRLAAQVLFGPRASSRITDPGDLEKVLHSMMVGGATKAGAFVSPESALRVAAVYAAVRILRTSLSHLPMVLYRQDGRARKPAKDDPLYAVLHDRPNEWQTSLEFRELMQQDHELRGNAYALIVRGFGGRVQELIRLHPDQVEPRQDDTSLAVTYAYHRRDGRRVILKRDEVFHLRGAGDDGLAGMSPIQMHRETVGDAMAIQEHASRFFSNGAKPLGLLEWESPPAGAGAGGRIEVKLSEPAREELKADFASLYAGAENAYKTILLPFGLRYKPVSISNKDAQYIEARKFTRGEIFSIFGIPPHKAGDLEKATFSNIEHQALEFVIDAIVPRAVRWEQALHRDLLAGDPDRYVKISVDGLLRGDAKSRAEALQIKRRNGVVSANEWRELDDMNPREDEGGDSYIVEQNMRLDDGRAHDPAARESGTGETGE